jgi:hypothetical protein
MNKLKYKKINNKRKSKILNNNIDYFDTKTDIDEFYNELESFQEEDENDYEKILKTKIEDDETLEYDEEEEEDEDIEKTKKKINKSETKEKFYVDPKEFDEQIMNYYKSNKIDDKLADMISKISYKLSFAGNFINYSYREEMVGDGIIRMMKALISKKYNRAKGTNPFSYFTRIAFNAFRNRIKKEKHLHETHEKYQREYMLMSQNFNNYSKNKSNRMTKEKNQ